VLRFPGRIDPCEIPFFAPGKPRKRGEDMKRAIEVKAGNLLLIEGKIYKVNEVEAKGAAKAHKTVCIKMHGVLDGKHAEHTYHQDDKIEEADVTHQKAIYSYKDGDIFYFIDQATFESYAVPKEMVGKKESFLKENEVYTVALFESNPISLVFPERIKMKIASAPAGLKGQHDVTTFKEATLENGMKIEVPQFIETDALIEVDPETGKYIDRVHE